MNRQTTTKEKKSPPAGSLAWRITAALAEAGYGEQWTWDSDSDPEDPWFYEEVPRIRLFDDALQEEWSPLWQAFGVATKPTDKTFIESGPIRCFQCYLNNSADECLGVWPTKNCGLRH